MGVGVAQNLAQAGHRVILLDISEEILKRAREEIAKNIRFQRLFARDAGQESVDTIMERIRFTTGYSPFADADFVIENVTEKWEIKKEVHAQLDAVCPEHCIFAANTSAISITRIGSLTKRPAKVPAELFARVIVSTPATPQLEPSALMVALQFRTPASPPLSA